MIAKRFDQIGKWVFVSILAIVASTIPLISSSVNAEEKYAHVAENLERQIDDIVSAHKLSPELQQYFEQHNKLDAESVVRLKDLLLSVGLGPMEYCCHNNGMCDCKGMSDCAFMMQAKVCSDDEPIVCADDGCECTATGPTFCPFDECCTD